MRTSPLFKVRIWLITFILISLYACNSKDEYGFNSERWSSSDPLNFSYRIRREKYKEGNLVSNPSFEQGKVKQIDKNTVNTKIDGWEIIGESVKWVNIASKADYFKLNEVHSGSHSIKIERHKASETEDFGQGVLSDYIRVIPGSYQLSLYINLKDIKNPKSRLGTKIYDAVDIRLMYYDRNKLQINGGVKSVYTKNKINSTFKGFSFSNFNEIDSTGWWHIIGRSDIFPFPDGDLPDETKFVRVFIGLKGTGTIWADDVNLHFTRWNLTSMERISSYFDSTFSKDQLIIPHPRKMDVQESKIYYRPFYNNNFPLVLIPDNPGPATLAAAKRLETKIRRSLMTIGKLDSSSIPKLIKKGKFKDNGNYSIIFSVGETRLFEKNIEKLPVDMIEEHDQGYLIHSIPDLPNVIFLYGTTSLGDYYAVQTALQLFDNSRFLFHNANIIDFPSYNHRALLLADFNPEVLGKFLLESDNRFDAIYFPGGNEKTRQFITGKSASGLLKKDLYFTFKDGNPDITKDQFENITGGLSGNINGIAWLFDPDFNFTYDSTMLSRADQHTTSYSFPGSVAANEISFAKNRHIPVEVLPSFGNNFSFTSGIREQFNNFNQVSWLKNNNVALCYNGYGIYSWRIDEADFYAISQLYGQKPIFFDYSMFPGDRSMGYFANDPYYPQKLQTACIFEPYDNEIVQEVFDNAAKNVLVFRADNIFQRIRLKTASDYFWNPDQYDPDLSLYRALIAEFGTGYSKELVRFNDLYFKIKSEIIQAANARYKYKHTRKIAQYIRDMDACLLKLHSYKSTSCNEANVILSAMARKLEDPANNRYK